MKDKNIETQESLLENLKGLSNRDITLSLEVSQSLDNITTRPRYKFPNLLDYVTVNVGGCLNKENIIPIVDGIIQIDGTFCHFCKEFGIAINTLILDSVSIVPYKDTSDDFSAQGLFHIKTTDGFSFLKSSLYFDTDDENDISSFVVLAVEDYEKYLSLKNKFITWLKQREGIRIKCAGGEEYVQNIGQTWDSLFFGEKEELKNDLKESISKFLSSKADYEKHNIPWQMSILVYGEPGCGKTELINTIISEFDLDPVTINPYSTDDLMLMAAYKYAENNSNTILFVENLDTLIDDKILTVDNMIELFDKNKTTEGMISIFTAKKPINELKDYSQRFDKIIDIGADPEYNKSITQLFGKYLSEDNLESLKKTCMEKRFSYGYLNKIHDLFARSIINTKVNKKKEASYIADIMSIIDVLSKESDNIKKKYSKGTKKIGLGLNKK